MTASVNQSAPSQVVCCAIPQALRGQLPALLHEIWFQWLSSAAAEHNAAAGSGADTSYRGPIEAVMACGGSDTEAVASWPARVLQLRLGVRHLCRCVAR